MDADHDGKLPASLETTKPDSEQKDSSILTKDSLGQERGIINNQEYETQYFGFSPKSFSDGIYNALLGYTWDCFQAVQQYLKTEYPSLVTEEQMKKANEVLPKLIKIMDKAFDKFEAYLTKNIFYIPNNVVLPEDEVQQGKHWTSAEEEDLDRQIEELKQNVKNAVYVNACLRLQIKDIEVVQTELDLLLAHYASLEKICKESGVPDLRESFKFIETKVIKVSNILDNIQQLTPPSKVRKTVEENVVKLKKQKTS